MSAKEPGSARRRRKGTPMLSPRGRVVVLAASCLVAAMLVLIQRQPLPPQASPGDDTTPRMTAVEAPADTPVVEGPPVQAPPVQGPAVVARAPRRAAAGTATSNRLPAAAAPTARVQPRPDVAPTAVPDAASAAVQAQAPDVTISGCLEQRDQGFRLTDTRGAEAPRSRTWRSGFIRRSADTIDVIDTTDRLHLPTYVGQRVSVTGKLVDREMTAAVVRIVAMSCNEETA